MGVTVQVGVILQAVIAILVTVITGLVTWALKRIICMDTNMEKLQTWKEGHEKLDDERHKENMGRFDMVLQAVKQIQRPKNWEE